MYEKLRCVLYVGMTAIAVLLESEQAQAFGTNTFSPDPYNSVNNLPGSFPPPGKTCSVHASLSPTTASLLLWVPGFGGYFSGGYWASDVFTPELSLSETTLAAACGYTDITNFRQIQEQAPSTIADLSYIGTTFRARAATWGTDVNGMPYNAGDLLDVEIAFSGLTNTVLINQAVVADSTSPTVTLSSTTTTLNELTPFTVTATFDEDVTGFTDIANDVTITNGAVTSITAVSASVYTLSVTPTGSGDVSISIPAAAAQDLANNPNTASTALVIGNTIIADTQRAIASFMLGRANNLIANQPGLMRFLQNDGCRSFAASATNGSGAVSGCVSQGNTWAEITGSRSGDDSYTLGSFGAHSLMNPNLLVGAMLQVDYAEDAVNNTSGSGWIVGPYFVARIPEQPFFIEGRLLYGQTDNDISPLRTFTDSFDTERFLAQLRATGEYKVQAFTLMPLLDVTYTDDTQKTYVDGLGNTIPGQTVSLTQVSAGLDFATDLEVAAGSLELVGGLSGIYSSSAGAAASPKFEHWRGRTHLGLNYGMATGGKLRVSTFYDGIGINYESYGASLGFDMEF